MQRARLRALSIGAAVIAAAASIVFVGAANADSPSPISIGFPSSTTSIPAHGASSRTIEADVLGTLPATTGTVTFDFTGLAGVATATLAAKYDCTTAAAQTTCPVSKADTSDSDQSFQVTVTSTATAVANSTGSFTASASADGSDPSDPATAQITVFDAPELDAPTQVDDQNVSPGDPVTMQVDLANLGSEAVPGVQIVFDVSHGIAPAGYDNCLYGPWAADNGTFVACTIPGTLAANQQVRVHGGFQGTIVSDSATFARTDAEFSATSATNPAPPTGSEYDGVTFSPRPHSGQNLTLDAEPLDGTIVGGVFPSETWGFQVDTTNEIAAIGANLTGNVGDTVNATVGFKDGGPAALDTFSSHESVAYFVFTVPTWATAVTVPDNCDGMNVLFQDEMPGKPGMRYYECNDGDTYVLPAGGSFTATIGLKITSTAGTNGSVAIYQDGTDFGHDPDSGDNIAPVTLTGNKGVSYTPITPHRILDTRYGIGAPKARVGADAHIGLTVAGVDGIPATGVSAVVLNVTAVNPTASTYITVYPTSQSIPTASNINVAKGQTLPNLVTVPVIDGKVYLNNAHGSVDLIADVTGFYAGDSGSGLNTVTPNRILDTRYGIGAPKKRVGPNATVKLKVAGVGGIPATGVKAIVMNVTAVSPTATGFLTVYPDGSALPTASNLNFVKGATVANLVIVPVTNGFVDLHNSSATIDLVGDVTGYYAATGSGLSAFGPLRVVDTRYGTGVNKAPVGPGQTISLQVVGSNGVPATGVTAAILNVTVTAPTTGGFLAVYPDGGPVPNVSNLNWSAHQTIANLVIVPVVNGRIDFHNATGSTEVIADLGGYFIN